MALGEEIAFEPLQSPDGLVEESPDLRDVARNREDLRAKPVPNGDPDLGGNRRLEIGGGSRKRLDLRA